MTKKKPTDQASSPKGRWPTEFQKAPLITLARLRKNWREALAVRPSWVVSMIEVDTGDDRDDLDAATAGLTIKVGRGKFHSLINAAPLTVAGLFELTRYGRVAPNSNHAKPIPRVHSKAIFDHKPRDGTPVHRITANAAAGERVTPLVSLRDYSPENAAFEPHRQAIKDARSLNFGHAKTAAEMLAPPGFNIDDYLANMQELFAASDNPELLYATAGGTGEEELPEVNAIR